MHLQKKLKLREENGASALFGHGAPFSTELILERLLKAIPDFVIAYTMDAQWYPDKFYIKSRSDQSYNFGY